MGDDPPVLVYDDDCGVCTRAAAWIASRGPVELLGFSELDAEQLDRLPDDWERCAHLLAGGEVYSCGAALDRAFRLTDHEATGAARAANRLPGYGRLREFGYRLFADHRGLVGRFLHR